MIIEFKLPLYRFKIKIFDWEKIYLTQTFQTLVCSDRLVNEDLSADNHLNVKVYMKTLFNTLIQFQKESGSKLSS